MPIFEGTGHGDLYIQYNVVLPTSLSPELKTSKSAKFNKGDYILKVINFLINRIVGSVCESSRSGSR